MTSRGLTFVNCTGETFTPTHSGAIAVWVYEMARQARAAGLRAPIVTRQARFPPYAFDDVHFLTYPPAPSNKIVHELRRRERKVLGWAHDRQAAWAALVVAELKRLALDRDVVVLNNDAVLASVLARHLPDAVVVNNFQNQDRCHLRFRAAYRDRVALTCAVSAYTASWVERHFWLPAGKVRVLHSGVDTVRFSPLPRPVRPEQQVVINFVGLTNANKGIDTLVEALCLVARARHGGDIRLVLQILGSSHYGRQEDDEFQRRLNARCADLKRLSVEVRRPGFVDRAALPGWLRQADIHVVPSRWAEPFGLVALEGMASGLATVVADGGGLPEVVGDAGLLFPRGNPPALAERLANLLDDGRLRQKLAILGRRRAETMGWDSTFTTLRAHLKAIGVELATYGAFSGGPVS